VPARPVTEAVVEEKFDLARENAYRLRDVFGKGISSSRFRIRAWKSKRV